MAKPVFLRAVARADADHAVDHYAGEAGIEVALAFIAALKRAYTAIAETPAAGSPRWSHVLNLPGLRTRRLNGFPWLVFYVELDSHVDVWRVLYAKRDIPAWMDDENGD